jgi:5-methylcytosine-specific restriction endonuclease McrA
MNRHEAHSSNAPYQQRILYEIDRDVRDVVMMVVHDPRLFTPTQKMAKLLVQGGVCPECNERITPDQKSAGHHVIEFAKGGPTTMENLQVLHEECHVALHARSTLKDLKQ